MAVHYELTQFPSGAIPVNLFGYYRETSGIQLRGIVLPDGR